MKKPPITCPPPNRSAGCLCLHPTALWEPVSAPPHSTRSQRRGWRASEVPSHRTGPSPHLPPLTAPPRFHHPTGPPSDTRPLRHPLAKSSSPPPASFRRTGRCRFSREHAGRARAAVLFPLGREGGQGLEKVWPCLPPPRSSPGNTSGSSRSARTNVSSTAGGLGRGREGKRQEGNG